MQTSMQLSRGGINFHLHFTEGKGLRQNMQHPFAAHSHRLNHLPGNPSTVRRLTAPLRVKQRPIQFDGVTAIRFCSAGDDLGAPVGSIAGVINPFSHSDSPLCPASILLMPTAIIPPPANALLLREHK